MTDAAVPSGEIPLADPSEGFELAVVEIYGHRRLAGRIREEERFGAKMLRIDIPRLAHDAKPPIDWSAVEFTTQFYGGGSLFSMTPCDEGTVVMINRGYAPARRLTAPAEQDEGTEDERQEDELFDPEEHC